MCASQVALSPPAERASAMVAQFSKVNIQRLFFEVNTLGHGQHTLGRGLFFLRIFLENFLAFLFLRISLRFNCGDVSYVGLVALV